MAYFYVRPSCVGFIQDTVKLDFCNGRHNVRKTLSELIVWIFNGGNPRCERFV